MNCLIFWIDKAAVYLRCSTGLEGSKTGSWPWDVDKKGLIYPGKVGWQAYKPDLIVNNSTPMVAER